jgi:hypothetical protein
VIEQPSCPICGSRNWREIGSKTYRSDDRVSDYARIRYRVLFEVWQPGAEEVRLSFQLCETCGFVGYSPRPTPAEVTAKYEFLAKQGLTSAVPDSPVERTRARELYRMLARHLPKQRTPRVLDYGGADGRLMRYFLEAGCECSLVDYCQNPIAGVARIATTERDIPEQGAFDLIVCSHVIEHVAEPVSVVSALARRLGPKGVLFVEVPLEIWRRAPIHEEPVTHVNFFSPESLARLFYESGLVSIDCRMAASTHPEGIQKVVKGWATLGQRRECPQPSVAIREIERLLAPDLGLRLRWRLMAPTTLVGAVRHKLKGMWPRSVERSCA